MIEAVSEHDDKLFEKYVEGKPLTNEEIRAGIRKATIALKIFPVICGSAFKNKGVQSMLDAVVDYLPSPLDVPPIEGVSIDDPNNVLTRKASDERAVRGAGVQDHDRPIRRPAGVFPRVLGQPGGGRFGLQRRQRPQGAHRAPAAHARQQARGDSGDLRGRYRRRRGTEDRCRPATPFATTITPSCSSRSNSRRR